MGATTIDRISAVRRGNDVNKHFQIKCFHKGGLAALIFLFVLGVPSVFCSTQRARWSLALRQRVGSLSICYTTVAYYVPRRPKRILVLAHGFPWTDGTVPDGKLTAYARADAERWSDFAEANNAILLVLPSAGRLLHRAGTRLVMSILKVVEQQPVDVELVQLATPLSRSRALLLVVVSEVAVSRKSLPVRGNVERGLAPGERFSRRPAELGRHQIAMKIRLRNGAGELQTSRGLSSQLDHAAGSHLLSEVGHLCRDALSSRGCAFQLDLEPYWFARPISGLFGIRILSISQSGLTERSDLESRKPGQVEGIALRDAKK